MKYKVKSRYQTYYEGADPEEAYQMFSTLKRGGMTNIKMTPDLSAKGFLTDFVVVKNKLIFSNEYAANLVNTYLGRYETPIELVGKEIVVLNDKFLSKIVYLTEGLFKKSAEITKLAKNKLGITNDVKKYQVSLQGGEKKHIFAYSQADATAQAEKVTDKKIINVKQLQDG
tara:strand:+ start:1272 stop:1784 length:513 start_codon:yes stop_codon:yes gene_type:complete